jgi:hypothetical protein
MVSDDRKAELIGVTASCLAHRVEARLINEYGIAFFDRYLNELPQPFLTGKTRNSRPVSSGQQNSELLSAGIEAFTDYSDF